MLLFVLQPEIDEAANGFGAGRQVLLRAPPVIDILAEALRRHELDALVECAAHQPKVRVLVESRDAFQTALKTATERRENVGELVVAARQFVEDGGLISYGTNLADQYRQAASYVDRVLRGEKPANLPVQQPTKFEFIINLKAAKQIGLTIPPNVLARADKVIK